MLGGVLVGYLRNPWIIAAAFVVLLLAYVILRRYETKHPHVDPQIAALREQNAEIQAQQARTQATLDTVLVAVAKPEPETVETLGPVSLTLLDPAVEQRIIKYKDAWQMLHRLVADIPELGLGVAIGVRSVPGRVGADSAERQRIARCEVTDPAGVTLGVDFDDASRPVGHKYVLYPQVFTSHPNSSLMDGRYEVQWFKADESGAFSKWLFSAFAFIDGRFHE